MVDGGGGVDLAMVPFGVAIIVVLAGALAVCAAVVVGMYLLRGLISPDKRGVGGTEDPRRACYWENFCCMYGCFVIFFLVALALFAAFIFTHPPQALLNK
jgi:hypothetical protein